MSVMNPNCRIGKVKSKIKDISFFPVKDRPDVHNRMQDDLNFVRNEVKNIDGYILIAWNKQNEHCVKYESGSLPIFDFPAKIAEMIRWSWRS